jgi:hypothetical protein
MHTNNLMSDGIRYHGPMETNDRLINELLSVNPAVWNHTVDPTSDGGHITIYFLNESEYNGTTSVSTVVIAGPRVRVVCDNANGNVSPDSGWTDCVVDFCDVEQLDGDGLVGFLTVMETVKVLVTILTIGARTIPVETLDI